MTDLFTSILSDLGEILEMKLFPDHSNALSIEIPPLTIQLELDFSQENLNFFTKIALLPPGRFREDIICNALKSNNLNNKIIGYIVATNHLTLHQSYPANLLNKEILSQLFPSFFAYAESWKKAIEMGRSSP